MGGIRQSRREDFLPGGRLHHGLGIENYDSGEYEASTAELQNGSEQRASLAVDLAARLARPRAPPVQPAQMQAERLLAAHTMIALGQTSVSDNSAVDRPTGIDHVPYAGSLQQHLERNAAPFADQLAQINASAAQMYGTSRQPPVGSAHSRVEQVSDAVTVVDNVEALAEAPARSDSGWNAIDVPLANTSELPPLQTTTSVVDLIIPISSPPYEPRLDLLVPLHFDALAMNRFESLPELLNQDLPLMQALSAAREDLINFPLWFDLGITRSYWPSSYTSPAHFRVVLDLDEVGPENWRDIHDIVMSTLQRHFRQFERFQDPILRYFAAYNIHSVLYF